jgi:hypothetical protein
LSESSHVDSPNQALLAFTIDCIAKGRKSDTGGRVMAAAQENLIENVDRAEGCGHQRIEVDLERSRVNKLVF